MTSYYRDLTGTEAEGSKVESGVEKKTLTPSYLTLTIGGFLKNEIDAYVEYAHKVGTQKTESCGGGAVDAVALPRDERGIRRVAQDAHLRELATTDTKELER
jgi:hypothetical protein